MEVNAGMHRRREIQSLEIHRRISELLLEDPERVLGKERANLQRWLIDHEDTALAEVYREWGLILASLPVSEIAELLVSPDDQWVRLRQSSAFPGILTPKEIWAIKRNDAAA